MWCSDEVYAKAGVKKLRQARMGILESIEELRSYKRVIFEGK